MNRERRGRKWATLGAVLVVSFLCGWSALGPTGGLVLTIALGAGGAAALLGGARSDCTIRLPWRSRGTRSP